MPPSDGRAALAAPNHLLGVYSRAPLAFVRGEGVRLYDEDGVEYLDCMAGIAVNALGHNHPALVGALIEQGRKLWHVSNVFRIPGQEALAQRLCGLCFADVVFFTNSGSEAMECALKMARRRHSAAGEPDRIEILGFNGAFHGRTYAAVNAAGNPAYLEGFGPALPGYAQVPFGDIDAVRRAVGPQTAAIVIEPVQGEGGARAADDDFLRALRRLCDQTGVLLIYDEVQCGLGRTGRVFAYEHSGAAPDIMCLAKALGGGFPIGACLATAEAASAMTPGAHGSTYGGNPLAMAVGLAAVDQLVSEQMLQHVRRVSGRFNQALEGLKQRFPDIVAEIRGRGLLIGLKLKIDNRAFMGLARDQRLLIAGGGENCVRLLPPLIISEEEAVEAVGRLDAACSKARERLLADASA